MPIHLLPQWTSWIPTCFLCTSSSKQSLSTLLVACLFLLSFLVSLPCREPLILTQQFAKHFSSIFSSKCHCHLTVGVPHQQTSSPCNADHIVQALLLLSCVNHIHSSLSPPCCCTLREPATGALTTCEFIRFCASMPFASTSLQDWSTP